MDVPQELSCVRFNAHNVFICKCFVQYLQFSWLVSFIGWTFVLHYTNSVTVCGVWCFSSAKIVLNFTSLCIRNGIFASKSLPNAHNQIDSSTKEEEENEEKEDEENAFCRVRRSSDTLVYPCGVHVFDFHFSLSPGIDFLHHPPCFCYSLIHTNIIAILA